MRIERLDANMHLYGVVLKRSDCKPILHSSLFMGNNTCPEIYIKYGSKSIAFIFLFSTPKDIGLYSVIFQCSDALNLFFL